MKLTGMAQALSGQLGSGEYARLSFEKRFGLHVDAEWTAHEERKLSRRLPKPRHPASLEDASASRARPCAAPRSHRRRRAKRPHDGRRCAPSALGGMLRVVFRPARSSWGTRSPRLPVFPPVAYGSCWRYGRRRPPPLGPHRPGGRFPHLLGRRYAPPTGSTGLSSEFLSTANGVSSRPRR